MKARRKFGENDGALALGLNLTAQLLFSTHFQKSDLGLEPTVPQKLMFLDASKRILLCTSRNVGKTISLIGRILRDIAIYLPQGGRQDEEILVFAPAEGHLMPVIDRLYANIARQPFFRHLVSLWSRGDKPKLITKTGLTVHGRIEGSSNTAVNMVGLHPFKIYGDECAFGDFINHREGRVASAMPETKWLYAGVPNGVRTSPFYELDQKQMGHGWSKHKFSIITGNPRFVRSSLVGMTTHA